MAINEMLVHEDGIQKQWAMYHVSKSSLDAKTRYSFFEKIAICHILLKLPII